METESDFIDPNKPPENEKAPLLSTTGLSPKKLATTYSPTMSGSTIGAAELNFSVRNGKRWILRAIATRIFNSRQAGAPQTPENQTFGNGEISDR